MNLKDYIQKISLLEERLKISELKVYDFNPWPYIRLSLLNEYSRQNSVSLNADDSLKKSNNKFNKLFKNIKYFYLYMKNPISKEKLDILFFTRSSESIEKVDGRLFNKYSDSLISLFSQKYKIRTLEVINHDWDRSEAFFNEDKVYINFVLFISKIKYKLLKFFQVKKIILNSELDENIKDIFDFKINIKSELQHLNLLSIAFIKILKNYKPKVVFLTVFYSPESMAISLACHRLGIRVVEYQHGAQNDYHTMYSNWNNIPEEGYELLPDTFWMWGEVSKKRIEAWTDMTNKHRAIVGGNFWMTFNKHKTVYVKDIENIYPKDKVNVLISLQGDQFFSKFLLEALNKKGVVWHFRDHPRLPLSDGIKKKISNLSNVEFEFSTNTTLYELLKRTDMHITGYSTVAFEAQSFNIPTIFIHPNAMNGYNTLINKNGLFFTESLQELNALIDQLSYTKEKIEADYIISDFSVEQKSLALLMESK